MNMRYRFLARACARTTLTVAAFAVVAAAWPSASGAQTAVRTVPRAALAPQAVIQGPPVAVQAPPLAVQVPPVTVQVPPVPTVDDLRWSLDSLSPAIAASAWRLDALRDFDLASLDASLAELQGQAVTVRPVPSTARVWLGESSYEAGLSALDSERWQLAIDRFDQVIKTNKTRVDGAMYWKAYAQDKLGQRNDALATLQALLKEYPGSRYLDDAKALELQVRQGAGQSVRPEDQTDEDLKLIALTSVMQADPARGIPLLQQILKGNSSLKIKQRALFLLSTSDSPQARDVLVGIAKGGGNPDLQIRAIRALGVRGSAWVGLSRGDTLVASRPEAVASVRSSAASSRAAENAKVLGEIYASAKDADVKREIIRSLMVARDTDQLLNIARTEPSAELRIEAIRGLGTMRSNAQVPELLANLYATEKNAEIREQILRSMTMSGNVSRAAELAKQEADASVRANAVRSLGTADSAKTGDALVQIYKSDQDKGVKSAVINALYMQQNAKALVDLARQEKDLAMKREIVSRLSTMKAKEATDYMLELLK